MRRAKTPTCHSKSSRFSENQHTTQNLTNFNTKKRQSFWPASLLFSKDARTAMQSKPGNPAGTRLHHTTQASVKNLEPWVLLASFDFPSCKSGSSLLPSSPCLSVLVLWVIGFFYPGGTGRRLQSAGCGTQPAGRGPRDAGRGPWDGRHGPP